MINADLYGTHSMKLYNSEQIDQQNIHCSKISFAAIFLKFFEIRQKEKHRNWNTNEVHLLKYVNNLNIDIIDLIWLLFCKKFEELDM